MGKYFIDPYKKYNESLNKVNALSTTSSNIVSSLTNIKSFLSNASSLISSSGWEEKGIKEIATSSIPYLIMNVGVLQSNFDTLNKATQLAINSLLPETENLKNEDAKYEELATNLNNLVIPVRIDANGEETSYYKEYITKKERLEKEKNESENKCIELQNKCDQIIGNIRSLDSSIQDFNQVEVSTSSSATESNSISALDSVEGGNLLKITFRGKDYYIANTKINAVEYEQYIQKIGMYQNTGFFDSRCALLSQVYACDMMRGTYTKRSEEAIKAQSPATRINDSCSSENIDDVLKYLYDETVSGRLTTLTVTQKASVLTDQGWKGPRHVVTVVGFDSSVKSYKDLNEDTILVLDCVDGKIQTLSQARSEGGHDRHIYAQGGKYFAHGATQNFLNLEVNNAEWQSKHSQTNS